MRLGSRNLITDVAGLSVGNAQCEQLKSGVTVLCAEKSFCASVDVMGGAPGTRETDLLMPDKLVGDINALVLAGGSAFGLDAASGVANALASQGIGFKVGGTAVPIVPAAILFDLCNGGDKDWSINPYSMLGQSALKNCSEQFALGSVGAGTGAFTASLKGGLGSASVVLSSGVTVGALVAVNALGDAVIPGGANFWAAPFEVDDEFGAVGVAQRTFPLHEPLSEKLALMQPITNTTIGIVATDATLDKAQLKRLAVAAQDGLARALVPAHTLFDGDLVFSVSTRRKSLVDDSGGEAMALGHAASICMTRAVARAVYLAQGRAGDILPTWKDKFG